jgi:hypothetical protein
MVVVIHHLDPAVAVVQAAVGALVRQMEWVA